MIIDYFYGIFSQTCIQLIGLIPGVLCLWIVFDLVCGLLFKD